MFIRNQTDEQRFFRPSCLPVLNERFTDYDFFDPYYEKTYKHIQVPAELTRSPEDTLLNYFSILREAANTDERSCGTIGNGHIPYPLAYNFLSKAYQKRLSYEEYVHSFAGVGHLSLIKLCRVPGEKQDIQFFYEIEAIEILEGKSAEFFGYAYGFIRLVHEQTGYRMADIQQLTEDFLCAPYHGWDHDGEAIIDVKYGGWCKLVQKRYPTIKNSYFKSIYFLGNDGADYCFIFITLTNGTDVEIAQFRRKIDGKWKKVNIKPEEQCT
ncbi:hypothetical protein J14TS2_42160 [Bacillus sp. J14TS2]|uniref:hypothetical protein n=1 Tax=Bacillus sp. J14TS2 TaxID=2807188 RepID=UPI001B13C42A|nr:hypothetical protein [Bacillus sp. J14TS2]GIN73741.1 hypothetical protein J14TS2_42160 [Bacillus sp. J14TS2]